MLENTKSTCLPLTFPIPVLFKPFIIGILPYSADKKFIMLHSVNLVTKCAVTPGKNQGQYVSCSAFPFTEDFNCHVSSEYPRRLQYDQIWQKIN